MSDPFRKIQVGDKIPRSATAYNAMIDAAVAERRRNGNGAAGPLTTSRSTAIVRVKNESGSDLLRGRVLGLDTPIFTPDDSEDAFLREVCFRGNTPAEHHRERFGVLLESIADGKIGRCVIDGVCHARVNIADDDHRYADVDPGDSGALASCWVGPARILWSQGDDADGYGNSGDAYDTGEQWAVIRIGVAPPQGVLVKLTSSIAARSGTTVHYGTATVATRGGGSTLATTGGATITKLWNILNKTVASGSYGIAIQADRDWWLTAVGDCANLS